VGTTFRGSLCRTRDRHSISLRSIAVDDAASVGRDIDASILVRVASNHEARVVPVVIAVIDLSPACTAIYRAIEATRRADLSGEVDGRVRLTGRWRTEANAISQRHISKFGETRATARRMANTTCCRVRTDQPDIIRLVVNSDDLCCGWQAPNSLSQKS